MAQASFGQLVDPQEEAIQRQRQYAQALRQQAMQPMEQQVVSGRVVPFSVTQGLANMLKAYAGRKGEEDADTKALELGTRKRTQGAAELQGIVEALRGKPAIPSYQTGANEMGDESVMQNPVAAQAPDQNKALAMALASQNPMAQQIGGTLLQQQLMPKNVVVGRSLLNQNTGQVVGQDATWQAEQEQARAAKAAELQAKMDDAKASRAERLEAQKEMLKLQQQGREDMMRMAASMRPAPVTPQPQIVTTPEGIFQVGRDGKTMPLAMPDGTPLSGKPVQPPGKALPTSAAGKLMENNQNLRRAEQALALMEGKDIAGAKGDANATGWKGYLPDALLQRTDKQGIDARAAIGDLGSLVIHDRSGAAVTAAEFPRLRPFIPQTTDDPATVKKKLNRFVNEYKALVEETTEFYKGSGYNVPDLMGPDGGKRGAAPVAPANGLPTQSQIDAELARRRGGK